MQQCADHIDQQPSLKQNLIHLSSSPFAIHKKALLHFSLSAFLAYKENGKGIPSPAIPITQIVFWGLLQAMVFNNMPTA